MVLGLDGRGLLLSRATSAVPLHHLRFAQRPIATAACETGAYSRRAIGEHFALHLASGWRIVRKANRKGEQSGLRLRETLANLPEATEAAN